MFDFYKSTVVSFERPQTSTKRGFLHKLRRLVVKCVDFLKYFLGEIVVITQNIIQKCSLLNCKNEKNEIKGRDEELFDQREQISSNGVEESAVYEQNDTTS